MREKLIELLGADTCKKECEDCKYCANPEACIEYLKTSMADHLIANGVTMEAYDCHWATETAYKNGYAQGMKDAVKWIPVTERLPQNFVSVLGYMTDAGDFPPVRECYTVGNAFFFPALGDIHPVSHWCEMPKPTKEENKC